MENEILYLVKSQKDLEAVHKTGIDNVICCDGPVETTAQWKELDVHPQTVVLLFDETNEEDIMHTAENLLECGVNVRIGNMPGPDPESTVALYEKEGMPVSKELFRSDFDYIDYLFMNLYEGLHGSYKKAEAVKRIVEVIDTMSDEIRKRVYLNDFAKEVDVPVNTLLDYLEKINELPF